MTHHVASRLGDAVLQRYEPAEFPCLWQLIRSGTGTLAGQRVLCGFPIFHNTLPLYWALVAAGADLVVTEAPGVPGDAAVVEQLGSLGIDVATGPAGGHFDIVFDCAGALSGVGAHRGYVELTKSGEHVYRECELPVFLVDAGTIKLIETSLGTGDGFVRALGQFGHDDLAGRSVVVFGAGKVGIGIADRCAAEGATVTLIDRLPPQYGDRHRRLNTDDHGSVRSAISSAWCIVTATGNASAVSEWAADLRDSPGILTNMGALDEYGPSVPAERVLNNKEPLNFALTEPTRLRHIDPSLALAVVGAEQLLTGRLSPGINAPQGDLEERVLRPARENGHIAADLAAY